MKLSKFSTVLIAMTLVFSSNSALAADDETPFERGNQFLRLCETKTWQVACSSYALGIHHGRIPSRTEDEFRYCIPEGVDFGQMYNVAIGHMRNHPERTHYGAFLLILESWQAAFPCN